MTDLAARVIDEVDKRFEFVSFPKQIHKSLVVFFQLSDFKDVCAGCSSFFLEIQLLYFVFFALHFLRHELYLSVESLDFFCKGGRLVSVLLIRLLESLDRLLLKLQQHSELLKFLLFGLSPL